MPAGGWITEEIAAALFVTPARSRWAAAAPGVSGGLWFFGFNSGSSGWVNGQASYTWSNRRWLVRQPHSVIICGGS
ncbi:hypothetical protein JOF56_010017 [Kibdelosporangium banguiense]|uniref:Uncharacterized protein n=1 Tax=Kibdelosporangium banguiense TaxID=1365924 RepID=A0ABS4TZ04_9PSEU|nr:hypothetical protein [Kibdelosporangium banguiense]